jgi:hypothetical protein
MKYMLRAIAMTLILKIPDASMRLNAGDRPEVTRVKSEANRATPRVIRLSIKNEDGVPSEGARIRAVLNNVKTFSGSGDYKTTDTAGRTVINIPPYHSVRDIYVDVSVLDEKAGREAYEIHLTQSEWIRYFAITQSFDLTLPYVRKPIPLKAKQEGFSHRRVNGPKDTEPADPRLPDLAITEVGYDAELLEPMPPHGQGKHMDFTIKVTSVFRGFEDANLERSAVVEVNRGLHTMDEGKVRYGNWTHTVTYRFPNKGDGIVLSPQFWSYCKLAVPHKAPEEGYGSELTLKEEVRQVYNLTTLSNYRDKMKNNGMFLRVRTQLDKDGNVVSANYAKIVSPLVTTLSAGNVFKILYNPTPNDRNLEYDLKTNLRWQELHPASKETPPWSYDLDAN